VSVVAAGASTYCVLLRMSGATLYYSPLVCLLGVCCVPGNVGTTSQLVNSGGRGVLGVTVDAKLSLFSDISPP
jgi:hypothetical protein